MVDVALADAELDRETVDLEAEVRVLVWDELNWVERVDDVVEDLIWVLEGETVTVVDLDKDPVGVTDTVDLTLVFSDTEDSC